jgi:hypothetical protein
MRRDQRQNHPAMRLLWVGSLDNYLLIAKSLAAATTRERRCRNP